MRTDPSKWIIAPDFECKNVPVDDPQRKTLFMNKPVEVGYNIVKKPNHENLKMEKHGSKKYLGENCVQWFVNAMLNIDTFMKQYFENEIPIKPGTIDHEY